MIYLEHSGMPLYLEEEEDKLYVEEPFTLSGYSSKTCKQMKGLIHPDTYRDSDERWYDVYREVINPDDIDAFRKRKYGYDFTYIMPNTAGEECKKTSGHYHAYYTSKIHTTPEVYGVIYGTAWFILQKCLNFDKDEDSVISDIMIAEVQAGQTIIIPPDYGHCAINAGSGPMVFCDIGTGIMGSNYYAPILRHHGMSVYAFKTKEGVRIQKNSSYKGLPAIKFVKPKENVRLGIEFNKPVYSSFMKNPDAFDFLVKVDEYAEEIMSMLEISDYNFK